MVADLTSGINSLTTAAQQHFSERYVKPAFKVGPFDTKVPWTPSFYFDLNKNHTIIVEASEKPYPMIFRMRHRDLLETDQPISVYCVCPEEAYLQHHRDAKELIKHGFGLLTVAEDGTVQVQKSCIPLVQLISRNEFDAVVVGLPSMLKRRMVESFERYESSAPTGVTDIAEVLEGLIMRAVKDAVKAGKLTAQEAPGTIANLLVTMAGNSYFQSSRPIIGSAQGYISKYRNLNHHFPKNKKKAMERYRECRHAYLEGLKQVASFHKSMKDRHLSGLLAVVP